MQYLVKLLGRISFKTFLFTKTYYYNMKSIKIIKYILSKLNHKFQKNKYSEYNQNKI